MHGVQGLYDMSVENNVRKYENKNREAKIFLLLHVFDQLERFG